MLTQRFLGANLNTIITGLTMAILVWLGGEVRNTALALVELRTSTALTARANTEALARLEGALSSNVSRREYDAKLAAVETRLAEIGVKLREIDMTLAKMQSGKR